jgi:formylglycine-generating enzyme required for sulfatase activity
MVVLPAGSFEMGSPASDPARTADEQPRHRVSFVRPFAVAKYAVTRGEFARFVAESGYRVAPGCLIRRSGGWRDERRASWRRPGFAQTDQDPVVCMSWNDGEAYADWLSRKTGHAYALLTEAQWEYAARAGTTTPYYWGAQASRAYANYGTERCCAPAAEGKDRWLHTAPSGSFPPNAFGLYDMHGNAWQWMQDCWHRNYDGAPADGSAWLSGSCVELRHVDHSRRGARAARPLGPLRGGRIPRRAHGLSPTATDARRRCGRGAMSPERRRTRA